VSEDFGKFYLVVDRYVYLRAVYLLDTIGWWELVISSFLKLFSLIYCSYRCYFDSYSGGDKFDKVLFNFRSQLISKSLRKQGFISGLSPLSIEFRPPWSAEEYKRGTESVIMVVKRTRRQLRNIPLFPNSGALISLLTLTCICI
jgi:hypothetical protein